MIPRREPTTALMLAGATVALVWALFWAFPYVQGRSSLLDWPEAMLTDLRLNLSGPITAPANIVIVAIDDLTLSPQAGGFPLGRKRLAAIIDKIAQAEARVLAVDVLLVDPAEAEADAALARALGQVPAVIAMAGSFAPDAKGAATDAPRTSDELWPLPTFAASATVGHVNVVQDRTGSPRHVPMVLTTSRGVTPAFVLQAATMFLGTSARLADESVGIGDADHRLDAGFHLALRLAGPTGAITTVSAQDLVSGDPAVSAMLKDRLVLLGFTAKAVGDTFPSPYGGQTPGVEVLASGIATLIGGPGLERTASIRLIDLLATLFLALSGSILVARLRLSVGLPLALSGVAIWLACGIVLFANGLWFSAALPLFGTVPPVLAMAILRQRLEQRAALRSGQAVAALSVFHSGALAQRIIDDPEYLAQPVPQEMAILFVDVIGFTAISEALGPEDTRNFLKELHDVVSTVVHAGHGIVLNYLGDGAMAVFGLPDAGTSDAENALQTAFALVPAVRATVLSDGTHPDLKVGVHFGPVIVSRLGHDRHQQVTIVGDAVNLASRLIHIAKEQSAVIAVSADLTQHIPLLRRPEPDDRARLAVRGRKAEVDAEMWRTPPLR